MDIPGTLGCIGGGQMAEALIRGVLEAGLRTPGELVVVEPDHRRLALLRDRYGVRAAAGAAELCSQCQILVAAVKPQLAEAVLAAYAPHLHPGHLLLSIMAGINLKRLAFYSGGQARLIRAMPNTPALVLAGVTALSPAASVDREDRELARALFSALGSVVEVPEEQLDAVTGLSGSGPGYVFTFLEALIEGGVLAGLPRTTAETLALHTLYGSAKLALESGEHPALLRNRVSSPGGTTITGLQTLELGAFRSLVMEAVQRAAARSRELGA